MSCRKGSRLTVDKGMVIAPEVCRPHVASKIELVEGAVKIIGATTRDHLDLATSSAAEISPLSDRPNLKLLDTLDRSRNSTGGSAAGCAATAVAIAWGVNGVVASHV